MSAAELATISKLQDNLGALQDIVSSLMKITSDLQERVKRLESRPVCIEMPRLDKAMTAAVNQQLTETAKAMAAKAKEN